MTVSKPTKVLHLITGLGVGGAETMLTKLLGAMDHQRFSSSVVSMTVRGPLATSIEGHGIPVHSLGLTRGVPNPLAVPKLMSILRQFRPVILQAWMYHADLLGLAAARAGGVPRVVWNIRCSDLDFPNTSLSLRTVFALHGLLSRFTDATVVNSASGRQFHQAHGHSPRRWELIPNGFDLERFRQNEALRHRGRAELGLDTNQIAIGMVARFDKYKDHDTFLAAAKILRANQPNTVFVLAGKGMTPENRYIVERVHTLGLTANIRLLGECADTAALLPALDIATLCSLTEGLPNAVGEAMASELPCVASDVGDCALLLGGTGRVVAARDPDAVAKNWSELIALGHAGRQELGRASRARIQQHFSLRTAVTAYEQLYENLTAS